MKILTTLFLMLAFACASRAADYVQALMLNSNGTVRMQTPASSNFWIQVLPTFAPTNGFLLTNIPLTSLQTMPLTAESITNLASKTSPNTFTATNTFTAQQVFSGIAVGKADMGLTYGDRFRLQTVGGAIMGGLAYSSENFGGATGIVLKATSPYKLAIIFSDNSTQTVAGLTNIVTIGGGSVAVTGATAYVTAPQMTIYETNLTDVVSWASPAIPADPLRPRLRVQWEAVAKDNAAQIYVGYNLNGDTNNVYYNSVVYLAGSGFGASGNGQLTYGGGQNIVSTNLSAGGGAHGSLDVPNYASSTESKTTTVDGHDMRNNAQSVHFLGGWGYYPTNAITNVSLSVVGAGSIKKLHVKIILMP